MSFSDLGIWLGDVSLAEINHYTKDPMKAQRSTLKKIVGRNKHCELGKKFHFDQIHSIEDYQRLVPLTDYSDYEPLVAKMNDEEMANLALTLCHQTDKLMFSYIKKLEKQFITEGGIKERMYAARTGYRQEQDAHLRALEAENQQLRAENQRLENENQRLKAELAELKPRKA